MLRYAVNYEFLFFSLPHSPHPPPFRFSASVKCQQRKKNENRFNLNERKRLRHLANRNWRHDIVPNKFRCFSRLRRSLLFPRLTLTVFQFSMESSSTHGNNIVKIRVRGKKSKRKSHSPPFIVCQHERTSRYSSPACIRSFRSGYRIAVLSSSGGCWMGWACMPANIFRIGLFCVQNICTEIHTFPRPSPSDSARAHGMHWVGDATFIFHTSEDRTAQQLVLPDWEKRVQTATTYFYSPFFVRRQKYIFSLGSNIFRYSFRKHRRESEPERAACVSVCVF